MSSLSESSFRLEFEKLYWTFLPFMPMFPNLSYKFLFIHAFIQKYLLNANHVPDLGPDCMVRVTNWNNNWVQRKRFKDCNVIWKKC